MSGKHKHKRHPWLPAEDRALAALYPHCPTADIAPILGRPIDSVYRRAGRLGAKKTEDFLASDLSGQLHKGGDCSRGAGTRLQKGQSPANKGLRRPGWAPGRMAETQFKKGALSGHAAMLKRPVGTILADPEGYLRIKIRERRPEDPPGWTPLVWPLLHHQVWKQHKGEIPPGHAVVFKDGKRDHCAIENLEMIPRAELARRNTMWNRYPRPLAEAIQLNGALKRKLRKLQEKNDNATK